MTSPAAPRRRWLWFSLKTLFVVVTVVGAGLGWLGTMLKWKQDRNVVLATEEVYVDDATGTVPWSLRLFGETYGIREGYVQDPGGSVEQAARVKEIRSLFPEAELHLVDMDALKIVLALKNPTAFDCQDTPLQDMIDYLHEYHHIPIQLDERALAKLDISPTKTTVTCVVKGDPAQAMLGAAKQGIQLPSLTEVPLESALGQLLAHVHKSLVFMIKDQALLITTERQKKIYTERLEQRRAALRARPPRTQSDRLAKALDEPTACEFQDTPLQGVADYFKEYHHIEITFDTDAIRTLGVIPRLTLVKSPLLVVSLRSALNLILARVDDSLTYKMQGDVLVITTRDVAGEDAADVPTRIHRQESR